ncbi:bifunctional 4-hydroxy-2-oxoglutarate aldolase/2-dehydro-3-deoxy-phosphogluconate aldolase [Microbacterium sp. NPDC090007]|uniref:bifunctional 4-hydroxy-2-oxoglutarate aldolase/2-dehydro-3-deoxy-phosphogluconate aldolase n=1 Tax=Microbacterium sp. NPDC090007 TaxID=3364204 RepID=UPI0038226934
MTLSLGPLLPVLILDDVESARSLAEALRDGGISQAEVTLRTPAALDALRVMASVGDLTVGAGTVLTCEQADASVEAGASFLVSPGWDPALAAYAGELGVPLIPGVATPSEALAARAAGCSQLKVFPISTLGGVAFIDALAAVFPDVTFVPSGGIRPEHAREYLSCPSVETICGSWMAPRALVAAGDFAAVTAASRAAVEAIA